jgi:hypothetical protein
VELTTAQVARIMKMAGEAGYQRGQQDAYEAIRDACGVLNLPASITRMPLAGSTGIDPLRGMRRAQAAPEGSSPSSSTAERCQSSRMGPPAKRVQDTLLPQVQILLSPPIPVGVTGKHR